MASFTFTNLNNFEKVVINPIYIACVEEVRTYDQYRDRILHQNTKVIMANGKEYLLEGNRMSEIQEIMANNNRKG